MNISYVSLRFFLFVMGPFMGHLSLSAADWPQFLGPNRDGISSETGWNADWDRREPGIAWRMEVGVGAASFAISGGKLYTTGHDSEADVVSCLDAGTGKVLWTHRVPGKFEKRMFEGGTAATPTVDGDRVYTLSHKGHLFCLQKDTGKVTWEKHLVDDFGGEEPRWGYAGSPLVYGEKLITEPGGKGASVVGLDKKTGKLIWKSGDDEAAYASPTVFGSGRIAVFNAYGLVGLQAADGREDFRVRWKTSYDVNATTPLFESQRGLFYITSAYRKGSGVVALRGSSGAELVSESKDMGLKFQSAVRLGDRVYGVVDELKCVNAATGEEIWDHKVSGKEGNVIAVDGKLIVLTEKGELLVGIPEADGFRETGRLQVLKDRCWVLPAFSEGRIYCRNNKGSVVCVDVRG